MVVRDSSDPRILNYLTSQLHIDLIQSGIKSLSVGDKEWFRGFNRGAGIFVMDDKRFDRMEKVGVRDIQSNGSKFIDSRLSQQPTAELLFWEMGLLDDKDIPSALSQMDPRR
jgi:hypothetical protein